MFNHLKNKNMLLEIFQTIIIEPAQGVIPALMIAGVAMQGVNAAFAMGSANAMNSNIESLNDDITNLANARQEIPDFGENIKDLSGGLRNPYASLGVATGAAKIQMEQTDIALANTLDAMQAGGMGAGGATALAQAASRSKQNVAANIEQQEASNEKLRAQGEQQLQQQIMAEKIRVQQGQLAADQFAFNAVEEREKTDLDRAQALHDNALAQQMEYKSAGLESIGAFTGSIVELGGTLG